MTGTDLPGAAVEALVQQAQDGDAEAFETLVRQIYDQVYRWALVQTGDADDADDVTQEVLFRLHTKLRSYKRRSRFTTWLYQVTRNAAYEMARRRTAQLRFREKLGRMETEDTHLKAIQVQPDSNVVTVIRSLFERLPSRQRQIFDLADLQGLTPTEIGDMLGMNPVTVRANLCKARRAIRSQLIERHPQMVEELGR
ncbi:MAG: RNA polymerase sigma factor [Gemmatimonadota bacterium]|nr:MAG: RNA polymerase sigma factor [Gemmatimonadota bacterium]